MFSVGESHQHSLQVDQDSNLTVRIGTRSSELAMRQSNLIKDCLLSINPDLQFQLISMETIGDRVLDVALSKIGDKSLFTKELEIALFTNEVDIVVHSLKDLPTQLPDGLVIGCVCLRESPSDAVMMRPKFRGYHLGDLPAGCVVGTSSVRRVAQLQRRYPQLKFMSVRGNLNTRLKKLDDPAAASREGKGDGTEYDALILAQAGIERMGWKDRIDQILSNEDCLYAVGQGALAVECRANDDKILRLLSQIHDEEAALTSIAERSLMRTLQGGCSTPVAVHCQLEGDWAIELLAIVLSIDGKQAVEDKLRMQLPVTLPVDKNSPNPTSSSQSVFGRKRTYSGKFTSNTNCSIVNPFAKCDYIGKDLLSVATNPYEVFAGVMVYPICEIGRLRMACARKCGEDLATTMLHNGAEKILQEIVKFASTISTLSSPLKVVASATNESDPAQSTQKSQHMLEQTSSQSTL